MCYQWVCERERAAVMGTEAERAWLEAWFPVYSNLVYCAPAAVAFQRKQWTRLVLFVSLGLVSATHHLCQDAPQPDCGVEAGDWVQRLDHMFAIMATCSVVLLFVPFESTASRVVHVVALVGAGVASFFFVNTEAEDLAAGLALAVTVLVALALAAWSAHEGTDLRDLMVRGLRKTRKHVFAPWRTFFWWAAAGLLAASLALWFTPRSNERRGTHGAWHLTTGLAAAALLVLWVPTPA